MKKLLITLLALLGLTEAAAADGPKSWTGVYAGLHGGYDTGNIAITAGPFGIDGLSANGFAYGLHAGADYQFAGTPIVVGVIGDYTWSNAKFTVSPGILSAGIDTQWAIGARAGVAMGIALPYVLVTYTEADAKASLLGTGVTQTLKGWQFGGGVELALTPNVSVAAEYRYTAFRDVDLGGFAKLEPENHSVMGRLNVRLGATEVAAPLK